MPGQDEPTIAQLYAVLSQIAGQVGKLGTSRFVQSSGAARLDVACTTALCSSATLYDQPRAQFFCTTGGTTLAFPAMLYRAMHSMLPVGAMKGVVQGVFGVSAQDVSLRSTSAAVQQFAAAWMPGMDSNLDGDDPVSQQPFTVLAKVEGLQTVVQRIVQSTIPNTNTPIVMADDGGEAIDEDYDATKLLAFMGECLEPFLVNCTRAEEERAGRAASNLLRAFEMIVLAAASAQHAPAAGQPVTVKPLSYMRMRFRPANATANRSTIFIGVDPAVPND